MTLFQILGAMLHVYLILLYNIFIPRPLWIKEALCPTTVPCTYILKITWTQLNYIKFPLIQKGEKKEFVSKWISVLDKNTKSFEENPVDMAHLGDCFSNSIYHIKVRYILKCKNKSSCSLEYYILEIVIFRYRIINNNVVIIIIL